MCDLFVPSQNSGDDLIALKQDVYSSGSAIDLSR